MDKLGFAALTVALACGSAQVAAAMDFYAYEGKPVVKTGEGGTRKTVDGVDFWQSGEPAHRFQVVGTIDDSRRSSGLIGMVRMSQLDHDVAKQVRLAGGDAVLLQGEDEKVTGLVSLGDDHANGTYGGGAWSANGSSFGMVRQVRAHQARYVVVKYLPDDAPAPAPLPPAQP